MAKDLTVDVGQFANGVEELVGNIPNAMDYRVGKAVEQATRKGVKTVKSKAEGAGKHPWSERYIGGFSSHVTKGAVTEGEIGNKNEPGLVHLLEKGHATPNGRRTGKFEHMGPAFDEIQEDFMRRAQRAVGEALEA